MKKELTQREQTKVSSLQAKKDQLEKESKDLNKEVDKLRSKISSLRTEIRNIEDEIFDLSSPFSVGDIVEDETGIRYRVTQLNYGSGPTRLYGIRLSKNGAEAFKDPRTIWAKKLKKVE